MVWGRAGQAQEWLSLQAMQGSHGRISCFLHNVIASKESTVHQRSAAVAMASSASPLAVALSSQVARACSLAEGTCLHSRPPHLHTYCRCEGVGSGR